MGGTFVDGTLAGGGLAAGALGALRFGIGSVSGDGTGARGMVFAALDGAGVSRAGRAGTLTAPVPAL